MYIYTSIDWPGVRAADALPTLDSTDHRPRSANRPPWRGFGSVLLSRLGTPPLRDAVTD
jgi:hypothetical protein